MNSGKRGLHIGFSGIDGAGKSTLAYKIAERMRGRGLSVSVAESKEYFVKQIALAVCPGGDPRRYFGHFAYDLAKGFDIVRDYYSRVEPLLSTGVCVVNPRTIECRLAVARALGTPGIEKLERLLAIVPRPDLVIRLRVDPAVACERVRVRGIDTETVEGLSRLSQAMDHYGNLSNWLEVDASGTPDATARQVLALIEALVQRQEASGQNTSLQ